MDSDLSAVVAVIQGLRQLATSGNWGRYSSAAPAGLDCDRLLGENAFLTLLDTALVPVRTYRLVMDGLPLSASTGSKPLRVEGAEVGRVMDPAAVLKVMADGGSLLLAGLEQYWPPVRSACRQLSGALRLDVSAFAVATPPGAAGFQPHVDKWDQVALQCEGEKEWELWSPNRAHLGVPLGPEVLGDATAKAKLQLGDWLYIPRFAAHRAVAGSGLSIHVTFILQSLDIPELVGRAVEEVLRNDMDVPSTVPACWDDETRALLLRAVSAYDGSERKQEVVEAALGAIQQRLGSAER